MALPWLRKIDSFIDADDEDKEILADLTAVSKTCDSVVLDLYHAESCGLTAAVMSRLVCVSVKVGVQSIVGSRIALLIYIY